jgi:hypothetical protein
MNRPKLYFINDLKDAIAFISGFDAATEWQLLGGFPSWLAHETGSPANLAWPLTLRKVIENDLRTEDRPEAGREVRVFFGYVGRYLAARP